MLNTCSGPGISMSVFVPLSMETSDACPRVGVSLLSSKLYF